MNEKFHLLPLLGLLFFMPNKPVYAQAKPEKFILYYQGSLMGISISLGPKMPINMMLSSRQRLLWLAYSLPKSGRLHITPKGRLTLEYWNPEKNSPITFDTFKNLKKIGNLKISYDPNTKKLKKIGKIILQYDPWGRLNKIGSITIKYRMDGTILKIGQLQLFYEFNKRLRKIGRYSLHYQISGRLNSINNVQFQYHPATGIILGTSGSLSKARILLFWSPKALWRYLRLKNF